MILYIETRKKRLTYSSAKYNSNGDGDGEESDGDDDDA